MTYTIPINEAVLDCIVAQKTAFGSFQDLVHAAGGYRPTLDVDDPALNILADCYDTCQEFLGDPRRASRRGGCFFCNGPAAYAARHMRVCEGHVADARENR